MPDARTHGPLRQQRACAKREMAQVAAIVRTLTRLVAEAGGAGGQAEVLTQRTGREEQA